MDNAASIGIPRSRREINDVLRRRIHGTRPAHRDEFRLVTSRRLDAEHEPVITTEVERVVSFLRHPDRAVGRSNNMVVAARDTIIGAGRKRITGERPRATNHAARTIAGWINEVEVRLLRVHHRVRSGGRCAVIRGRQELKRRIQGFSWDNTGIQIRAYAPSIARTLRSGKASWPFLGRGQHQRRRRHRGLENQIRAILIFALQGDSVRSASLPADRLLQRQHPTHFARRQRPQRRQAARNKSPSGPAARRFSLKTTVSGRKVLSQNDIGTGFNRDATNLPVNAGRRVPFIPRPQKPDTNGVASQRPRNRGHTVNQRARRKSRRRTVEAQRATQHTRANDRAVVIPVFTEITVVEGGKFTAINADLNDPAVIRIGRCIITFKVVAMTQREFDRRR